jgi:FAD-dependent urate hydroxylase
MPSSWHSALRDRPEITDALAAYERLRRPRVERVVRYSARVGSSKSAGPIGRWLRDLCMPVALKLFASSSAHAWLYRHHIDWNARVTPDAPRR